MLSGAARAAQHFAALSQLRADIAAAEEQLQAGAAGTPEELRELRAFQLKIREAYQKAIQDHPNAGE